MTGIGRRSLDLQGPNRKERTMLGTMAMALALSSLGAPQATPPATLRVASQPTPPAAAAPSHSHEEAAGGCGCSDGGCDSGDSCGSCGRCGGGRGCGHCSLHGSLHNLFWRSHSTCDMPPPEWSCAETHGYYYFRPYNYGHVAAHQEFASSWGIDPRNPYSNEFLKSVYEQVEAKWQLEAEGSPGALIEEVVPPSGRGKTSLKQAPSRSLASETPSSAASTGLRMPARAAARSNPKSTSRTTEVPAAARAKSSRPAKATRAVAAAPAKDQPAAVTRTSALARTSSPAADSQPPVVRGWQRKTTK